MQERKSLSLTVRPDMTLLVKCPKETTEDKLETFLRKKWSWLNKQLRFFGKFERSLYEKEYVSGESFLYLGRQYKLTVKRASRDQVMLTKGKLQVLTSKKMRDSKYNKILIESWYEQNVERIFEDRYSKMLKHFNYKNGPDLVVKKMDKRWGSFSKANRIALNPRLVHASKDCIDYVIAHELCHTKYKNHDKCFYKLLKSKVPDWEKIKEKLELRLG